MATINKKVERKKTHEGGAACHVSPELQLKRTVMGCMLWENTFYEDGVSVVDRITELVKIVDPMLVQEMAIEARNQMNLRHVPLMLAVGLARNGRLKKELLGEIIQRPDELTEFLAMYWKEGKCPLSAQVKKGLALAFKKFDSYQLAKYNRPKEIKLKDVLFLCHAKPDNKEQEKLWQDLINDELKVPDTWEVGLSTGKDKEATWSRLLSEKKLGGLALLRNLRNMKEAGVDEELVGQALAEMKTDKVLPFRYIAAAKHAPQWESWIEGAMMKGLFQQPKLPGKTIFVVDVSGSMYNKSISRYSEMDRAHVACSLAILVREMCEDPHIYATAGSDSRRIHKTKLVPGRHGFALSDAIYNLCDPLGGGGIFIKQVMDYLKKEEKTADRIIVITDEQDCDNSTTGAASKAVAFGKYNYLINVSTEENGIGFGKWTHINGFSEAIMSYIREYEKFSDVNVK